MHCSNGICLLSIFLFTLYLHSALASYTQRSSSYGSGLNYSSKTTRGLIINSHRLRRQNDINGGDRKDSITKPTSAGISVASRSDNGRNLKKQTKWRTKYGQRNSVLLTSRIFPQRSTQADIRANRSIPSNNIRNVSASANIFFPDTDDSEIVIERTYFCWSNDDCDRVLEKSFCEPEGHCICLYPYVFDGEKCQVPSDIKYCKFNFHCFDADSFCVLLNSTGYKICKCNYGMVYDRYRCLQKVKYLGECISDKQCPSNVSCMEGICRQNCPLGYIWLYNRCIKEHPYDKNKDSVIITHPAVLFGIIGGIPLIMLFTGIAVFIRRYWRQILSQPNTGNSSVNSLRNESSTAHQSFDSVGDQPPSYDEVMSASTLTLPRNSERINEDLPPSYRSLEEGQHYTALWR